MSAINDATLFSLRLSLQVATVATVLVMLVGISVAYILARKDFRGRVLLDILITLPLVLPPTVTGYYLVILFGRNGFIGRFFYDLTGWSIMFTWYAAVLASFVVALPLMIKTARAAMESVDKNLVNASYSLGHSELETVFKVILPLSRKGIIAGVVLSFARALGEFGATLMIAGNIPGKTDTMPLAIYTLANSGEWSTANFMVLFLTLISGFFLYITNRVGMRAV
ncbi:MAG: molybdenum ABC transporter permease subunit [bacterium]|nr:MAG: molybdenum ABC transporter permease subunit [bacterium]